MAAAGDTEAVPIAIAITIVSVLSALLAAAAVAPGHRPQIQREPALRAIDAHDAS